MLSKDTIMLSPKKINLTITKYYGYYLSGDGEYLIQAYQLSKEAYEKYPANIDMFFWHAFLNIELGRASNAITMLTGFKSYMSYFKGQNSVIATYYFLQYLADKQQSKKAQDVVEALDGNFNHLLCYMHIKEDHNKAYPYLDKAFNDGCRSPFLYLAFNEIFKKGRKYYRENILLSFLKWASIRDVLTEESLKLNWEIVGELLSQNIELFIRIYKQTKSVWLLKEICLVLAKKGDYTEFAHVLYKELIAKQIYDEEINTALLYSAYNTDAEDVSRFSIKKFLSGRNLSAVPKEVMAYIFHLILSTPHLYDIEEEYSLKDEIIVTAVNAANEQIHLQNKRYYNSLFCYTLKNVPVGYKNEAYDKLITIMEDNVFEVMFSYTVYVKDPAIKFVWVSEHTRQSPSIYTVADGAATIRVSSHNFKVLCLDETKTSIVHETPKIEEHIKGDFWLYNYFYKKNKIATELLVALSIHFVKENTETEQSYDVLSRTMRIKGLSKIFKKQIISSLGNVLSTLNNPQKALDYYRETDTNTLDEKYIAAMFNVFTTNEEHELALNLIYQKSQNIEETILSNYLVETINNVKPRDRRYKTTFPLIIDAIYELLIKGVYKEEFVNAIIDHYGGSVEDWCYLSNVLNNNHINNINLDIKILSDAIKMRHLSPSVQQVFMRLYTFSDDIEVVKDFVYYLCYQVISNNISLEKDIIETLKAIYIRDEENKLLLITLGIAQIKTNEEEQDEDANGIIKAALAHLHKEGMFLPAFADVDTRYFCVTHIGKPDQTLTLYYKIKDQEDFTYTQMKYFRFGIYVAFLPIFYNDEIEYHIYELNEEVKHYKNEKFNLAKDTDSTFFAINNALIYYEMFKYDDMEKTLDKMFSPQEKASFKML